MSFLGLCLPEAPPIPDNGIEYGTMEDWWLQIQSTKKNHKPTFWHGKVKIWESPMTQMNDLVKKRESSWNEIIEVNPMQLDSNILRLSWRFLVDISVGIEHNDATHQEEQDLKVGEDAERNWWLLDEVFRSLIRFLVFDFLIFLYFCLKPASARFVVSFLWLNFVCSWRKAKWVFLPSSEKFCFAPPGIVELFVGMNFYSSWIFQRSRVTVQHYLTQIMIWIPNHHQEPGIWYFFCQQFH